MGKRGRKPKPKRCKRCNDLLSEDDDVVLTEGHCHDCYLVYLEKQSQELENVFED